MLDFILSRWSFPAWPFWPTVFPIGLLLGSCAGWFAGTCRTRWDLPVGYTRKIFHFIIFTLAGVVGLWGGFEAVQVFGASIGVVVGAAVLRMEKSGLYAAVARPSDAPFQRLYIVIPFLMTALGGMLGNILFGQFAIVGYVATGWGDAVGEPVGTRWGRHRYRVPTFTGLKAQRSIEGSLAVFAASLIGCAIVLYTGFELPILSVLLFSSTIALTTMLVEAVTFHSMDNLTIQVTASGMCYLLFRWCGLI